MNSAVRLAVTPTATTPKVFTARGFEAFFSRAVTLACSLFHLPVVSPGLSMCKCGTTWSTSHCLTWLVLQPPPCHASSLPQLPVSPLLPVWLNVSSFNSLSVRLPYRSICWQFQEFFVFKFVVVLLLVV